MSITLAVSSLLLAAPAVLAQSTGTGSCTDVHIFLARGWDEDYDNQRQITLVDDICADLPDLSCDYEDVVYDAFSDDYCGAVEGGDSAGLSQINAYYAKCPSTTLVLSGYSEGSNIIGDILAGGTCADFTPLSTTSGASCNIAAAALWGDPWHAPYQPYNVLNGTAGTGEGGTRSDAEKATLDYYTPRLHSYCQYDDLVCATGLGADLVSAHTDYFDLYSEDAASWIAGLVSSFQTGMYCNNTSSTSSSSSSMPATSSSSIASSSATTSSSVESSSAVISSSVASASATLSYSASMNATASATPTELVTVTDETTVYTTICPLTATVSANGTTSASVWTGVSTVTSTYSSTITTTAYAISGSIVSPASTGASSPASPVATSPASSAAPSTITLYSTEEITVTSCAATVTNCPASSTVVMTTSVPISTTVMTPSAYAVSAVGGSSSTTGPVPGPSSSMTMINGSTAIIAYGTTTSMTTYANYPTFTFTSVYPAATSFYSGWFNGTALPGTATVGALGTSVPGAVGTGAVGAVGTGSPSGAAGASGSKAAGSWASTTVSPSAVYTGAASNVRAFGGVAGAIGLLGAMLL